jgi:DNA-binding transcriptional LysR family regulator
VIARQRVAIESGGIETVAVEVRQLRYFAAVARHLHFGDAARALHMAQPPLSQQIIRLEQELGVRLFHRTSRQVELTEEGRMLLEAVRVVLGDLEHVENLAARLRGGTAGRLRIGFVASVLNWGLAAHLRSYRQRNANVEITVTQMPVIDQVRALADNTIDVGFLLSRVDYDHLTVHELSRDPVVVALPEDHPQAAAAEVRLADLAEETFIAWHAPYDEHFDDYISEACAGAGFVPRLQFHGPQVHTVLHMVAAGFGVGLIRRGDAVLRAPGTVIRPLAPPGGSVVLSVAYHRYRQNPAVRTFVEWLLRDSDGDRRLGSA